MEEEKKEEVVEEELKGWDKFKDVFVRTVLCTNSPSKKKPTKTVSIVQGNIDRNPRISNEEARLRYAKLVEMQAAQILSQMLLTQTQFI